MQRGVVWAGVCASKPAPTGSRSGSGTRFDWAGVFASRLAPTGFGSGSGGRLAGLASSRASPAPIGIGGWLLSVAGHVDQGCASAARCRAFFDGERDEAEFRVEQQPSGVFVEAGQLHFPGLILFKADRGHGFDNVASDTLATGVRRDDDVADAADAVVLGTVEVGEADELAVGQKSRGVEALADRGVHLFFRQRVLRFREHEVQLLNTLRKAAQGFDVVGRHWPVGEIHRCPALTFCLRPNGARPARWHGRGRCRVHP